MFLLFTGWFVGQTGAELAWSVIVELEMFQDDARLRGR